MDIDPAFYDAELRVHNGHFRAAAGVRPGDRVLDIGCGSGQTTREAARVAVHGSVLGVDVSAAMLEWARRQSDDEGLSNVTYEQADAQTHRFRPAHFDRCISRCGVMFFTDPVAAFTNIGRALRPAARLVLLVWQDRDRNEWATAIRNALTEGNAASSPAATPIEMNPFSLADPVVTGAILTSAGFSAVNFADIREPIFYGPDPDSAYDAVLGFRDTKDLLAGLDATATEAALQRLRAVLATHDTTDGVRFDARTWIVTAQRDGRPT